MDNQEKDSQQKQFFALFTNHSQYVLIERYNKYYTFRIVGFDTGGAGIFESIDATCAKYVKEVSLEDYQAYLNTLPNIHMIMSYETDQGWLCCPFMKSNTEDSLCELRDEVLVQGILDCERFDIISARYDGMHFWFDDKIVYDSNIKKSRAMRLCLRYNLTPERMKYNINRIKRQLTQEDHRAFDLAIQSWLIFQRQSSSTQQSIAQMQSEGVIGSYVVHSADTNVQLWQPVEYKYASAVDNDLLNVTCVGVDMCQYESIIKQERIEDE